MKDKRSPKTIFVCQSCGYQTGKWLGKCPECAQWNSIEEQLTAPDARLMSAGNLRRPSQSRPVAITSVEMGPVSRMATGSGEFDRVLGGGLVPGSLILIGGDPGIGKSTLMLQVLHGFASENHKVLYVSGEESVQQIKLRSDRLGSVSERLWVVSETSLEAICSLVEEIKPDAVVVDSVQTVFSSELASAPGSVGQVREAAMTLMVLAKRTAIPIFLVGHVTKEGAIAGPRLLEHMVDTVLYFEGGQGNMFRILRAVKNRFGSTNEIGVFEMKDTGLCEVPNPSSIFLTERSCSVPGSVVTASIEGSRPILLEIQGLVSKSGLATPRRTVLGVDHNRVSLLVAVMEKKMGMPLMGEDVFVNVAGGVKVDEPAVDLGIVAVIASSFLERPVRGRTLVLGEVGLTGEVRPIGRVEARISEAAKMGFERCLLPRENLKHLARVSGITLVGIDAVSEAVDVLF